LVIDRSGSLTPFVQELRSTALSALGHLKPEDQVAFFAFSEYAERLSDFTNDRLEIGRQQDLPPFR